MTSVETIGNEPTIYLDKKEAAAQLRVSERTISYWMKKRIVLYVKLGRTVRFRRVDFEETIGLFFPSRAQ